MRLDSAMRRLRAFTRARVYSIGVYVGPSPLSLGPPPGLRNPVLTRDSVTDVPASFVADPFMIEVDRTWYMFFEVMSWRGGSRKGEIGLATSADGFRWAYRGIVLAEPYHLSYPYVFRSGADFFMVPEGSGGGAARLYRADPFPDRWVRAKDLLEGPVLLDNSIFEWDGRWWMFAETSPSGKHDTLRLFHARDLRGPWTEHPRSPIVAGDPRISRPAGRVIALQDRLVRLAQDCSSVYGESVRAIEVTRLSPHDYEERELGTGPVLAGSGRGWNGGGMHQLDAHPLGNGQWIACVDGWSTGVRRPRELVRWAANHFR
jgi:hypothetical protein